jgi:hypothetical protein
MANPYYKPEIKESYEIQEFVMTMLQSQTNAHILHLQSRSYSEHKALQGYYEGIDGLIDDYVEAYQGKYGIVEGYSGRENKPPTKALDYMLAMSTYLLGARPHLPTDSELNNILDEMAALIDKTIYKLRYLE